MKKYNLSELSNSLKAVGICPGDSILVHSSLFSLGILDGVPTDKTCETICEALIDFLGHEGTILVPSFFYEYAKHKEPYDVGLSPVSKSLGIFAQYVTARKDSIRSCNPIFSLSGIGANAEYICRGGNAIAFGVDSPWDRLTRLDGKLVVFGGRVADTLTYLHYVDHRYGVPHMYHKHYDTPIYENGKLLDMSVSAYVRYLDYGIEHETQNFEQRAFAEGLIQKSPVGLSSIYSFRCRDVFSLAVKCLNENIFFFLNHRPKFKEGEYPLK